MTAFATAAASLLTWQIAALTIPGAVVIAWCLRAEAVSRRRPPLPPAERSTR